MFELPRQAMCWDRGRRSCVAVCLFVLSIAAVYHSSLRQNWVSWDDNLHITENPYLNPPDWRGVAHFWLVPYENLYIPVSYSVFALELWLTDWIWPGTTGPHRPTLVFKAFSLFLHVCNAGLVWWLIRRLVGHPQAALIGVLLFALHPLQVESVAWISETRGLLSATLGLLAVICHMNSIRASVRAMNSIEDIRKKARASVSGWNLLGVLCFGTALLAKPTAVSALGIVVMIDLFHFKRSPRQICGSIWPWAALVVADWWITRSLQASSELSQTVGIPLRIPVAADALAHYLSKLIYPAGLTIDYGRTPRLVLESYFPFFWSLLWAVLGFLVFCVIRSNIAKLSLSIATVGLLPVCGLIPFGFQEISTVADRYAYLALIGPATYVASIWTRFERRSVRIVILSWLFCMALVSSNQVQIWRDSVSLYTQALTQNPNSWIVLNNWGVLLDQAGDSREAEEFFRNSIKLHASQSKANYNLAVCLKKQGKSDLAEALFLHVIELDPGNSQAHEAMAQYALERKDLLAAERHYRMALEGHEPVGSGAARLFNQYGNLLFELKRMDAARDAYQHAVQFDPDLTAARLNLGRLLFQLGELQLAESHLQRVVAELPDQAEPWYFLGLIAGRQGRLGVAIERLQHARAIPTPSKDLHNAIEHELSVVCNAYGLEIRQTGDLGSAQTLFREALSLDPRLAAAHYNLAQILIVVGNSKDAKAHLEQAAKLVPPGTPASVDIATTLRQLSQKDDSSND